MKMPLVSVIIPVYNGSRFLRQCIDSVLEQTYKNIEIVVVNDGSSDATKTILAEYEKRVTVFHRDNRGRSAARNYGLHNSHGQYVLFLDADDWLLGDHITELINKQRYSRADIVYSRYLCSRDGIELHNSPKRRFHAGAKAHLLLRESSIAIHTALVNKKALTKHDIRFNEKYSLAEDYDFWARCVLSGMTVEEAGRYSCVYRTKNIGSYDYQKRVYSSHLAVTQNLVRDYCNNKSLTTANKVALKSLKDGVAYCRYKWGKFELFYGNTAAGRQLLAKSIERPSALSAPELVRATLLILWSRLPVRLPLRIKVILFGKVFRDTAASRHLKKVAIFANFPTPYVVGLYNALAQEKQCSLTVFYDKAAAIGRRWYVDPRSMRYRYIILNSNHIAPWKIILTILKERPEIIISHELGPRTIVSIVLGKLTNAKVFVYSELFLLPGEKIIWAKKRMLRVISRITDGAIAVGRLAGQHLAQLGFNPPQIVPNFYAVDNRYYLAKIKSLSPTLIRAKLEIPKEAFVFLYVGKFTRRKGMDLMLKAAKHLACANHFRQKVVFLVVGHEGKKRYHKNIAIGQSVSICILDFVHHPQLVEYYAIADCFLLPSRKDNWGVVVNEAMASGAPVAISKYAGAGCDMISHMHNGIIFDPANHREFATMLLWCIKNPKRLEEFATRAKSSILKYNHHEAAKRIIQAWRS